MRVIYVSRIQAIRTLVVLVLVIISIVYTQTTQYDVISVFLNTKRELPIYSVETDEKKIAISFDAAWGAEYTDEILDILKKRNIKATFFLVGFWIDKYPEKVKRIASEGHEIGNHSTTHPHMSQLSSQQIRMEIETTQKKIEELAGDRAVKLFRPPFGDYNDRLILTCREMGYYPIQWDVDSLDWKEYGVEHMFNQVTKRVRNGSIVLFHNNAKYIVQALPLILDHLIQNGYTIVPVSELIYKDNYYIDHTGRQRKMGT
ncbi:polysaccharide deacetylase family sporulation protein PdaB [Caldicoprobacter guelmensis]|uniref:polysaccharide deacetylase family protein n=1 Tax=Caldicoprobacter guelmensis TaxID=1170224 RepID=UPI0019581D1C|nr:polysaccharide deacetylase family protein [Caldicoprobacter guelmensis]MBM7581881.1 polysaccharide deacetylase family sporulation protein PdaB [Caldicoprobacter guelmensis]